MAEAHSPDADRLVANIDDLLEPFHAAAKPAAQHLIGAEAEKIGLVYGKDGVGILPYEGDMSILRVLSELRARFGWQAHESHGPLLSLVRAGASVTLEPGGQLELSGAPLQTLWQVDREAKEHLAELAIVSDALEVETGSRLRLYGLGFHPIARREDLSWVPKARYGVMRRYLPTKGNHGLDMMLRTATVQANFDFVSEEDAMRKLRVLLRISPFVTAMFANSPFYEGAPFGGKSFRARVWLDVDPDRQGLVPSVLKEGARFVDYVTWALDCPMFLVLRGDRVVENTGQTFRAFMRDGFQGERATMADWTTHLNTMFPEVRLKKTLELRGADSLPRDLVVAPAALATGILYDEAALAAADAATADFDHAELVALRQQLPTLGLAAPFRKGTARDVAMRIVAIAREGLGRRGRGDRTTGAPDESGFLDTLEAMVARGETPADRLAPERPVEAGSASGAARAAAWGERLRPVELVPGTPTG